MNYHINISYIYPLNIHYDRSPFWVVDQDLHLLLATKKKAFASAQSAILWLVKYLYANPQPEDVTHFHIKNGNLDTIAIIRVQEG